jgi:hypothetical protein
MGERIGVERLMRSAMMLPVALLVSIEPEWPGHDRTGHLLLVDGARNACRAERRHPADAQFGDFESFPWPHGH